MSRSGLVVKNVCICGASPILVNQRHVVRKLHMNVHALNVGCPYVSYMVSYSEHLSLPSDDSSRF